GRDDEAVIFIFEPAAQGAKEKATRDRAHQAQRDIDHAAAAVLAHDAAGQPADKRAEYDPAEYVHFGILFLLTMGGLEPAIQGNKFDVSACVSGWPGQARPWRRFGNFLIQAHI